MTTPSHHNEIHNDKLAIGNSKIDHWGDDANHHGEWIVVLIHGTYARDAPWTQEGSDLCKVLGDRSGHSVLFRRFRWSGANSHRARLKAGTRLRRSLQGLRRRRPHARIFLIAHSHGGNVALDALADPRVAAHVGGVVTMGTPFIWSRRRHLAKATRVLGAVLAVLLGVTYIVVAVGLMFLMAMLGERYDPYGNRNFILIQVVVDFAWIIVGGLMTLWLFNLRFARRGFEKAVQAQRAASRLLRCRPIRHTPLLRITIRHDEAELFLKLSWLAGELPAFAWRAIVVSLIASAFALALTFAGATGFGLLSKAEHATPAELRADSMLVVSGFLFAGTLSLTALALLCQVAMIVLPRIVRRFAFGRESLAETWLLHVRPHVNPPLVPFARQHDDGKKAPLLALRHSQIYQTSHILSGMVEWLKSPTTPEPAVSPRVQHDPGLLTTFRQWMTRLLQPLR